MLWSEEPALDNAMTHMHHQLLLAARAHDDPRGPTLSEEADHQL